MPGRVARKKEDVAAGVDPRTSWWIGEPAHVPRRRGVRHANRAASGGTGRWATGRRRGEGQAVRAGGRPAAGGAP
ncbi:hypothetical protein, partial [Micromonospora sp. 4G55]|uniref:hypothetical protein n=1 Tax=Micromonospora sp. 4G55 TaxID=2806102 RepID=UPI001EE4B1D6